MILAQAVAPENQLLPWTRIQETLHQALAKRHRDERLLVLIPDHTRSIPLPRLFRMLVPLLQDAKQLDFMVALGTHPPLSEEKLFRLVGITAEERRTTFHHVGLLNHAWAEPGELAQIATITRDEVRELAAGHWHQSLDADVPVRINRLALEYDHILIVGPTFPHEVAGFSGGAKYLFPGISGPEMIDATHWLGALAGVMATIGVADTPVRRMIHAAAAHVPTPITLLALVVQGEGLAGLFIGDLITAWKEAADLSAQCHVVRHEAPFRRILSCAAPRYDELWTAAKAMYKLEPAVADGGELIIYAPHLETVSQVHGRHIHEVGYHVLDYFLKQWEQFRHVPLGVLAHSTHVRGAGRFENGQELPRIQVTLSSRISPKDCARLSLGYADPGSIDPKTWRHESGTDCLVVPKAGEVLHRVRETTEGPGAIGSD